MRNYAVRFGLEVEANAKRFFALGAQLAGKYILHAITTQSTRSNHAKAYNPSHA
jgi:hypothetical protein